MKRFYWFVLLLVLGCGKTVPTGGTPPQDPKSETIKDDKGGEKFKSSLPVPQPPQPKPK